MGRKFESYRRSQREKRTLEVKIERLLGVLLLSREQKKENMVIKNLKGIGNNKNIRNNRKLNLGERNAN